MTTTLDPDGSDQLASRRLGDAVHALCDPVPEWFGGAARWQQSLYQRLREALAMQPAPRRGLAQCSRLPCSVNALDLLIEIDATTSRWTPDAKGTTVDRLRTLTERGWRPQDVGEINRHCDDLARWTIAAAELLTPPVRVYLPHPCPRCGARFTYVNRDGEMVRTRALKVSEDGCRCGECGSAWEPARFHFLAALLGCDPLTA